MNRNIEDVRGTAGKGIGRGEPERNVDKGSVIPVVPDRIWNVRGFDIGKANVDKAGIQEDLKQISEALRKTDDPHPQVIITGHASVSRFQGAGAEKYERARAEALKQALIKQGVPERWIQTETSGTGKLPASAYTARQKTAARGATIEIKPSGQKRATEHKYSDSSTYVKGTPTEWPPRLPPLGPIRGKPLDLSGGEDPGPVSQDDQEKRRALRDHAKRSLGVGLATAGVLLGLEIYADIKTAKGLYDVGKALLDRLEDQDPPGPPDDPREPGRPKRSITLDELRDLALSIVKAKEAFDHKRGITYGDAAFGNLMDETFKNLVLSSQKLGLLSAELRVTPTAAKHPVTGRYMKGIDVWSPRYKVGWDLTTPKEAGKKPKKYLFRDTGGAILWSVKALIYTR